MLKIAILSSLLFFFAATSAFASWSTSKIVEGLLCIHDGKLHSYTGNGDPYRIRFYTDGADVYGNGEGSWWDANSPQWGGLQMDSSFQQSYGPEYLARSGTAEHWPTWIQLQVGVRGARARNGFNPWPNTRLPCGLPKFF